MNVTTPNPNRLPSNPPWRPHSLGPTQHRRFPFAPAFSLPFRSHERLSRNHRNWRRALAVPTEGGCMAAWANLQILRDNATEIAPSSAAIPSRNLHIRFSCESLSLFHSLLFSTSIKKRKRYSYNILTIDNEVLTRPPLRDTSTRNRKGSKPAGDTKSAPLVVEYPFLPSSFPWARAAPFRLEQHRAISFTPMPRPQSSNPVTDHLVHAPLQPRWNPPSIMNIQRAELAMPLPGPG